MRPVNIKRDMQTIPSKETCIYQKRPAKEIYKKDLETSKKTCKRDQQKRPVYIKRDMQQRQTKETSIYQKRQVKETYKRDKRDL